MYPDWSKNNNNYAYNNPNNQWPSTSQNQPQTGTYNETASTLYPSLSQPSNSSHSYSQVTGYFTNNSFPNQPSSTNGQSNLWQSLKGYQPQQQQVYQATNYAQSPFLERKSSLDEDTSMKSVGISVIGSSLLGMGQQTNSSNNQGSTYDTHQLLRFLGENYVTNKCFDNVNVIPFKLSPYIKYKIIPYLEEKKALDITSTNQPSSGLNKGESIIWSYHGGPNQHFYFKQVSKDRYQIYDAAKGFLLQPKAGQKGLAYVVALPKHEEMTSKYEWTLQNAGDNVYTIGQGNLAMDLFEERTADGTKVILWENQRKNNQKWRIVPS